MKKELIRWDKLKNKKFNFILMPKRYGKSFHKYKRYTKEQLINRIIELELGKDTK